MSEKERGLLWYILYGGLIVINENCSRVSSIIKLKRKEGFSAVTLQCGQIELTSSYLRNRARLDTLENPSLASIVSLLE